MSTINPADWEARAAHIRQSIPRDQLSDTSLALVLNSFLMADDQGRAWAFNGFSWSVWDGQQWTQASPPPTLELQPFSPPDGAAEETGERGVSAADEPAADVEPVATLAAEPEPEREPEADPVVSQADEQPPAAGASMPEPAWTEQPASSERPSPVEANHSAASSATGVPATQAQPTQSPSPQPTPVFQYRPTHAVPAPGMAAWSRPDPSIAPEFRLWPGLDVMVVEWLPSGWARVVTSNQWSGWVDGRILVPYR